MPSALTDPTVAAKYERVHKEGNLLKRGLNSCLREKEVALFNSLTTSAALSVGHTLTKRWT